jgi:hypothetical protein
MYEVIYRDAQAARHTFQKSVLKEGKENITRPNLTKKLSKMENTNASQLIRLSVHAFRKHAQAG